jgi:hypothetical protein
MAAVITTLDDAIQKLNTLYNGSTDVPVDGDEDYEVWKDLLNAAINIWEKEEGILWKQLFVNVTSASTGDKATDGGNSYSLPSDFVFPNSAYVWLGTGTTKLAYKVIRIEDKQLYENDSGDWCYFTGTTLEFNPNITIDSGSTINYSYYKKATALSTSSSTFEMTDPMFAVYYALSELKKEEGDTSALTIATQKLDAMKTINSMTSEHQDNGFIDVNTEGFGI